MGPAADGSIPALQRKAMQELGGWLAVNGAAIYGTRPWTRMGERTGAPRRYTTSGATVHVHALDPAAGEFELPSELAGAALSWADGTPAQTSAGGGSTRIVIPAGLREAPVAVLTAHGA